MNRTFEMALVLPMIAAMASSALAKDYADYPAGYKFGAHGDGYNPISANPSDGYDGWPGDTPPGRV